jgi:hypothetical protein
MVNKLLNIDLSVELLEIIDKEFKLVRESDTKLLNSQKLHCRTWVLPDVYSLLIVMAANITLILLKL